MGRRSSGLSLDELREVSLALRSVMDQRRIAEVLGSGSRDSAVRGEVEILTGEPSEPPVYNLAWIWFAAKHDAGNLKTPGQKHYMSPRRFVNGWPHLVGSTEVNHAGELMADMGTALSYCTFIDDRVMGATIDQHIRDRKAASAADPIGNAVDASKGGGFAMMFAREDARHLGLTDEEFGEAVMARAKEDSRWLDDYAAERLLSRVRQAIESCPAIHAVRGSEIGEAE